MAKRQVKMSTKAKKVLREAGFLIQSDEMLLQYLDDIAGIIAEAKARLDEENIIVDISNPNNPETSQEQRHPAINIYMDNVKLMLNILNSLNLTGTKRKELMDELHKNVEKSIKNKVKTPEGQFDDVF
jgi:phage terminase small subunit